ncbi:MAG TPA: hypothetical protein VER96_23470 [Polyangiaceae bacterium]|nr:hypothetical protein [Polyangiaceae bacterium]
MSTSLTLTKWYLDLVTDDGRVRIAYIADLAFGPLRLGYESLLRAEGAAPAQTQTFFQSPVKPSVESSSLAWHSHRLSVAGRWQFESASLRRSVLRAPEGNVDWHCIAPGARVELTDNEERLTGLGYVECLTLTIPPWRLPIDELYWGRFVAPGTTLVWIDWRGRHAFRSVVLNGEELATAVVSSEGIVDPVRDLTLTYSDAMVLRAGLLGGTALSRIPERLRRALPANALSIDERKWRARGTLNRPGQQPVTGWVIHEVVKWP